MTVYIPTMSRLNNLCKVLPRWLDQGMDVRLVVPREQHLDHLNLASELVGTSDQIDVITEKGEGRGIGYARKVCVAHAQIYGLKSIIIAEDDTMPADDSDMWLLLDEAEHDDVLGVGAVRRIHDHFTGGAISRNRGVILCPGGWGFQLFGLNVRNAIKFGNYDEKLHTLGDDAELARLGIVNGIPWRVHCDVWFETLGSRYSPGGIEDRFQDRAARTAAEKECTRLIYKRWPKYTGDPSKKYRFAWAKMLDDYIPNWREQSAIHGGHLEPRR